MNASLVFFITFFTTFILNGALSPQQKLEQYCKKYPQEWQGHYNLGRQYYQQENFEQAENCFSNALKKPATVETQSQPIMGIAN